ncbi:hypothetical protein Asphe3_27070 [Pseudarthrobacter phenanthrenivorans Sphe3]|uniref:Uncharacterized protein n=1 Tax=Pseudarthrobacter phenanthrenivorans (strain DSM 18606 / JCM 16027 / LMG 23796 / Sphe3) TaxID=930171 RepID=F0M926_PSEPM|nr:hypothetical protein Asphe3_27070 [Pseudarthrobacter phenanthrenivorans Sphe3]
MDFPLSSSVILVVAVVLWIVWVAPYVLRNGRHQFQPAGDFLSDVAADETPEPPAGLVLNVAAQQEKAMDTRKSAGPSTAAAGSPAAGAFRIRYGRTAIALVGLVSLVTAFVSAVLLLFGLGAPFLPLVSLAVTFGSVVLLRWLAVRDRRAKVNAAFRSAMTAPARKPDYSASIPPKPEAAPAKRESPLFDAEAHEQKIKPLTAMELREAALAVAVAAGDPSAAAASASASATWEPVEVPKPVYVEAAKAERPAPEPLELPEAPKAVGKPSLKQGVAAAPPAAPAEGVQLSKAQSALSNLDDVLQRRRA